MEMLSSSFQSGSAFSPPSAPKQVRLLFSRLRLEDRRGQYLVPPESGPCGVLYSIFFSPDSYGEEWAQLRAGFRLWCFHFSPAGYPLPPCI